MNCGDPSAPNVGMTLGLHFRAMPLFEARLPCMGSAEGIFDRLGISFHFIMLFSLHPMYNSAVRYKAD